MFKKYISYILGVCFVLCLGACNKENLPYGAGDSHNEPLVIKLAFASTRTELGSDGTPRFKDGDPIIVYSGEQWGNNEVCNVQIEDGYAVIKIQNPPEDGKKMQLIYPADCSAKVFSEELDEWVVKTAIPAEQDGIFAKANICVANNIDLSSGYAKFELAESLLKFDLSSHPEIKELTIYSDRQLNSSKVTNDSDNYFTTINFSDEVKNGIYYVAIQSQTDATIIIKSGTYKWKLNNANFNNKKIYTINLPFD